MADIRLVPMTDGQYARYRETAEVSYAEHIARTGVMALPEALNQASAEYAQLLPDGLRSSGQHLFRAYVGSTDVGTVWLHLAAGTNGLHAWFADLLVDDAHRRRGYGRAMVQAAEQWCRTNGATKLSLNVFSGNDIVRSLFEHESYLPVVLQMSKVLDDGPGPLGQPG